MAGSKTWYHCDWHVTFRNSKGEILWEETKRNALVDEGERSMLMAYFRAEELPTQFFIRLCNDNLVETDTLSDILNEPSGHGYSPQLVERSSVGFPTIELNSGDYRLLSKTVTFTASGGSIGPVNTMYLATTSDNTGKLISFLNLSLVRTILDGDSGTAELIVKIS